VAGGEAQDAGHLNYFGMTDNIPALHRYEHTVHGLVFKELNRWSQRRRFSCEHF
jgi:hypothetical protein